MVTVRLIGAFRGISGKRRVALTLKDRASLKGAIHKLAEDLPKLRRILIDPELEESRRDMLILVNGREMSVLAGLETTLREGDEVTLIPVVHGG
jgi:MoaD family protein